MPKACELRIRLRLALPLLIASVVFAAAPLRAQTVQNWKFKILDENDPTAQAGTTNATGINDAGTAVGDYVVGSSTYWIYGFKYTGTYTNIAVNPSGCTNACNTLPNGINNSGEIVGEYDDPNYYQHAFYNANGQYNVFDFPQAYYTIATGVSNKGTIAGFYQEYAGADERDSGYGANVNGFIYTPGKTQPTQLNLPGCTETELYGVNDSGTVVGNCPGSFNTVKFYGIAYNPATQVETDLIVQNSQFTHAYGINDVGQIVGAYNDGTTYHCFLYSSGSYIIIPDPPGSTLTICTGINNAAQVAGYFLDAQSQQHGFIATGPVLLDPVPTSTDPVGLLNGPAVGNTDWLQITPRAGAASHGLNGRIVNGIAADGVSEIVIRVPAKNAGDQFTFTLVNVFSNDPQSDGALGAPGDTSFTQSQVTVSAVNLTDADGSQSPYAFAVYRAPVDFVRQQSASLGYFTGTQHYYSFSTGFSPPCGGPWPPCFETVNFGSLSPASRTDDQLASRGVTIQIQDVTNGNTFSLPVEILRPPVVLIHGLWSNWRAWNNFTPLVNGDNNVDPRFSIGRVNYDRAPGLPITATDPPYSQSQMQQIHENSFGIIYNAPLVLGDVEGWIDTFKGGNNPVGIPVAAVQADIVAHSMGGDIARTFVLQPTFLAPQTFGSGSIHKLITIDTPHLGSELAADLDSPGEKSGCAATLLALRHKYVLNTVAIGTGIITFPGAIADLSPGSIALFQIANQNQRVIPTALIAGVDPTFVAPDIIAGLCSVVGDPLGVAGLTATGWASLFNGQPNDAIVTEASQLDGLISAGDVFSGKVHSPSIEWPGGLGFAGPSVLDEDSATGIPSTVIKLLNTPITSSTFVFLNP